MSKGRGEFTRRERYSGEWTRYEATNDPQREELDAARELLARAARCLASPFPIDTGLAREILAFLEGEP